MTLYCSIILYLLFILCTLYKVSKNRKGLGVILDSDKLLIQVSTHQELLKQQCNFTKILQLKRHLDLIKLSQFGQSIIAKNVSLFISEYRRCYYECQLVQTRHCTKNEDEGFLQ